jgi:hypothetical protein
MPPRAMPVLLLPTVGQPAHLVQPVLALALRPHLERRFAVHFGLPVLIPSRALRSVSTQPVRLHLALTSSH